MESLARAPEPARALPATLAPYVGLRPFEREERDWFFGRDQDARLLHDKILASRLTILYSLSGRGKSSLLRALVIPQLEASPALVIPFEDWAQPDPIAALREKLSSVVTALGGPGADGPAPTLLQIVDLLNHVDSRPVILVFDQFEEFLTNHQQLDPFRKELGAIVRSSRADVQVVLSLREEFLGALEPFREEILNLFQSTYRLGALDDRQVADVIRRPAEFFKGACDSDLLGALIQDLKPAESQTLGGAVDLPMLQIVCEQLWTEAQKQGDRRLTLELYTGMGRAQKVLEEWVERAMPPSWDEQVLTARMMLLLAPSSGLKMSFPAADLAKGLDLDVHLVEAVLKRLSGSSRPVLRQRAYRGALAYELQHDALIKVLRPWGDEILRDADMIRQRASAQRTRRIRAAVISAGAVFVLLASILFVLWRGKVRTEQAQEVENLIRQVTDRLQLAPAEAVLLGVAAHELARRSGTNEALRERAEQHLREALVAIGRVSFLSNMDMTGAAVDRDALTLAGSTGTSLQIWNVGRPASPAIELKPRSGLRINSWALSSDGGWAAIADEKSCVSIWQMIGERAEPVRQDECVASGLVKPLTFSADGKRLAVGIDRVGLELWSIHPRLERTKLPVPESAGIEVLALVFSRDSQTLLAGITTRLEKGSRGRLLRWHVGAAGRVPDPEMPWQDDNADASYQRIAIGDDGRWLADVDQHGTLRVWERGSAGKMTGPLIDMPHRDIRTVAFAGQGPRLALGRMGDRTIAVWNVATRTEERVLRGHVGDVSSVSLTGARWLASVAEKEVRLWDLDDPSAEPRILASSPRWADALLWPDQPWGVIQEDEGAIRKVDLGARGPWEPLAPPPSPDATVQAVSRHGRWLATGSTDGHLSVWERPFATGSTRTDLRPFEGVVGMVEFSPDETWLVAGAGGRVLIMDLTAVPRAWDITPTDFNVEGLAFSPDSRRVAAGLASGHVIIWQLRDEGRASPPAGPRAEPRRLDLKLPDSEPKRAIVRMAFHPDSRRFAAVYPNGVIRLWNIDHPGNLESLDLSHGTWRIRGAAFSPDRRRLALGSIEGLLLLTEFWDANRTSRRIDTLETEEVAWRLDGRRLAAGASDGTIHIWDVIGESAIDKVRLPQQGAIRTLAFSFDGRRLASVGEDQGRTLARLWTLDGSDLVTLACRTVPPWSFSADRCTNEPLKAACQVCQDTTER